MPYQKQVSRTVVVDKVCDADAEESRVEAGIEAGDALALDDAARGIERRRLGALRFDLGAGREGDERVAGVCVSSPPTNSHHGAYVKAMDSSPPPAPASACATLSLCCAAVLCGTDEVDSMSFSCAFSCV